MYKIAARGTRDNSEYPGFPTAEAAREAANEQIRDLLGLYGLTEGLREGWDADTTWDQDSSVRMAYVSGPALYQSWFIREEIPDPGSEEGVLTDLKYILDDLEELFRAYGTDTSDNGRRVHDTIVDAQLALWRLGEVRKKAKGSAGTR